MPITNFGGLLNFAEEIEKQDMAFYSSVAANPEMSDLSDLFQGFAKDGKKNIVHILRTRRENVTEMILEPIIDFFRKPFVLESRDDKQMDRSQILEYSQKMETRAIAYYTEGAIKIKALPEVSQALKLAGKKRIAHTKKLSSL
jgi:rubrerythrin